MDVLPQAPRCPQVQRTQACNWSGSALKTESTLHQLSPYIGKIKSSMAASLVSRFTSRGGLVYDPFSRSGTVALEAWFAGRPVVANDLSPYAKLLTRAKLFPYQSLDDALEEMGHVDMEATRRRVNVDLRKVPGWVRQFFHPETLRDAVSWRNVLLSRRRWFLMASLLGILHHCCPVKSRIESIGWGHRGIRLGSRMAGVPVKGAFFRIA